MRARFQSLVVTLALIGAGMLSPLQAQTPPAPQRPPPQMDDATPPEPPKVLPKPQRGDRSKNLDQLFAALKAAPDESSAKAVEGRIWAIWLASPSDTANLLMTRVRTAVEARDLDLALRLLNAIIEVRPDYAEAWNRRATIRYMKREFGPALADIRQVLAREPRHFGALTGLGMIMQEVGDEKNALDAFRRALAVHPKLQRVPDLIKTLTEKVEGRDI